MIKNDLSWLDTSLKELKKIVYEHYILQEDGNLLTVSDF